MEKRITELMDYIQDDTITLGSADLASTQRIKEATMRKIENNSNNVRYIKRKFKAVTGIAAAAALLVTLSGVALATNAFGITDYMMRAFFGENYGSNPDGVNTREVTYDVNDDGEIVGKHESGIRLPGWERVPLDEDLANELIGDNIITEDTSFSWDGYTLTAQSHLFDPLTGTGLLYYTLENPDGISGYDIEPNGSVWFDPAKSDFTVHTNWASRSYIDSEMSTDTKIYLCDYYVKEASEFLGMNLRLYVWSYTAVEEIGDIVLSELPENSLPGLTLADGNVKVSPIGIRINDQAFGVPSGYYIRDVVLRYDDGSEYVLIDDDGFINNSMYALISPLGTDTTPAQDSGVYNGEPTPAPDPADGYSTTYLFNRLVDINSLTEIIIDGHIVIVG